MLRLIFEAHSKAATENYNLSSVAFQCAVGGGALIPGCFAAAISSVGLIHAPVTSARSIIFTDPKWKQLLAMNRRVPGFGNSFFKDGIDPAFQKAYDHLPDHFKQLFTEISDAIFEFKKVRLYPNAAAITAAAAEHLGLPEGGEFLIFLIGRGAGWIKLL